MVVLVGGWVDVERVGEAAVALETEALVVALELGTPGSRVGAAGEASEFLLAVTAGAAYGSLDCAWDGFVAS
jgi:hypothetical protein